MIAIAIESVRQLLADNGLSDSGDEKIMVRISPNENKDWCECDECMRIYAEEEEVWTGVYLRFLNAIANEFPDVTFECIAYQNTKVPPVVTKIAENVQIQFCTDFSCLNHSISECEDTRKKRRAR